MMINKGFTLLEMIMVLFIVSILSFIGIQSMPNFMSRNEKEILIDEIKMAVDYAKTRSVNAGKRLKLLPLDNDLNWSKGAQLLEVKTQKIDHVWQWRHAHWAVYWQGVHASKTILLTPNPMNAISNGHFNLINLDTKEEVHLVLNRLGRLKIEE